MTGTSQDMQIALRIHYSGSICAETSYRILDSPCIRAVYLLLRLILNYGKEAIHHLSEGEGTTVHQRADRHSPEVIVLQWTF